MYNTHAWKLAFVFKEEQCLRTVLQCKPNITENTVSCFSGDLTNAAKYLKKSVETTEKIFGADSIELGNELHKLSQVLFNDRKVAEAKDVIESALRILTTQYGSAHPVTQDLLEMKMCLMDVKWDL